MNLIYEIEVIGDHMAEELLARGAEAKVYAAELLGRSAVIKRREAKAYRVKELDENLRRARTKNEARAMSRASEAGVAVPQVFYVSDYDITMERLDGVLLREKKVDASKYSDVGELLAALHTVNIAHGDFTPANIIVCKGGFAVIDFGLSVFSRDLEEKAIDLFLMEKSIAKEEYGQFLKGYRKYADWKAVIDHVDEIRKRGRYWERGEESEDEE
jgi:Kae1-associated kinase Bud32